MNTPWPPSAEDAFQRFCEAQREQLLASGADPDEVFASWRQHIAEETKDASNLTADAVLLLLSSLQPPNADFSHRSPTLEPAPKLPPINFALSLIFGVILPFGVLLFELFSGICRETLFDPLPTWFNVVLVALVPVSNLFALMALSGTAPNAAKAAAMLSPFAIGIAIYYALQFALFTPFAVIGIIYFGAGLIPLAPLISLLVALRLRIRMRIASARQQGFPPPTRLWPRTFLVIAALVVIESPHIGTRYMLGLANSESPAKQRMGLRLLRSIGDPDVMLKSCYPSATIATPTSVFLTMGADVSINAARDIYYRVTGTPFNVVKPPVRRGLRGVRATFDEWDFSQGGDVVANKVTGLSLQQSRLDAKVEAEAGLAYVEWTMVFWNIANVQREARAQILLPPGASVSRLTLWIDGEEREAAFGGRGETKAAYKAVVQRRRDPVLVTTCGPDRVLMQCFPVPPNGGTMKVRVGMSVPLALADDLSARLILPRFLEENFSFATSLKPSCWIESDQPVTTTGTSLTEEHLQGGVHALRGDLRPQDLTNPMAIAVARTAGRSEAWCDDSRTGRGFIRQQILGDTPPAPDRLAIVIDGSRRMKEWKPLVETMLVNLPAGIETTVFVADDASVRQFEGVNRSEDLARFEFAGGRDNVPALVLAWEYAAAREYGTVLWLHATQPMESPHSEQLKQRFERRPGRPVILSYQFGAGPNRLVESLPGQHPIRSVPATENKAADMERLSRIITGKELSYTLVRTTTPEQPVTASIKASHHLARLWAADEIQRLAGGRGSDAQKEAIRLAVTWQLVTPVSGAVVLETQEQYAQAGLKDIDPASAPMIVPEPGTGLLLAMGVTAIVAWRLRRRQLSRM